VTLIPDYFNLFDYFLGDDPLARFGRNTAIEFRGSRITYAELRVEVHYWTSQLTAGGLAPEDRVALLLYDSPEFIAAFLAIVSAGAIAVPINTFLSAEDVGFIVADSGASTMIAEQELESKISQISGCRVVFVDSVKRSYLEPKESRSEGYALPATTADSPAFLLYTSGSTGTPKGVLHRHGAIPATVETYGRTVLGLSASDRVYSASRLFFAYGLGNSLSFPLAAGASVILDAGRPTADRVAQIFEEQSPTVFFGVPALYGSLLEFNSQRQPIVTSSLRSCISAGEALPAKVFEDWKRALGFSILDGIGSTEMLHIFISNHRGAERAGSSGTAVQDYEARLLNQDGNELAGEATGDLWIRGESATVGYWNRPDLSGEVIRDGWVRTGDIYRRDEQNYYYHVGRADDCFKVKGLWVSPVEVEGALLAHDSVLEAAVVPGVDEGGLATPRAFVVIRKDGARVDVERDLVMHLAGRLAKYKLPSKIVFVDELPRTATGKIQRFKLRGRQA
jgi:benzoate-CoA ligase family protein